MIRFEKNTSVGYNVGNGRYHIDGPVNSFISVGLKVTGKCALSCTHCCAYDITRPNMPIDMPYDYARLIIGRLVEGGIPRVSATGGEPLLYDPIVDVLHQLNKSGVSTGISSSLALNGNQSRRHLLYDILPYVHNVKTSLLGTEETHDSITQRRGSYSETTDAIGIVRRRGVPVFVQTSILQENKHSLAEVARGCEKMGVSKMSLYSLIKRGRGVEISSRGDEVPVEEGKVIFEELQDKKKKEGWGIELAFIEWGRNGQYILILQNGDLTAGPVDNPPSNDLVVGSLLEESVQQLWEEYPFKDEHVRFYQNH